MTPEPQPDSQEAVQGQEDPERRLVSMSAEEATDYRYDTESATAALKEARRIAHHWTARNEDARAVLDQLESLEGPIHSLTAILDRFDTATQEARPQKERVEELEGLIDAARSKEHTIQFMPDPDRFEIIYAGKPLCPNGDPFAGDLVRTILVEPTSSESQETSHE